jgi:tetratricopeptide (TPR) repeat protein
MSNAIPGEDTFDFGYEATFLLDTSSQLAYDKLISEPLKIILLSVSADMRHQTPAFEFQLYLDPLLTHRKTTIAADLIGKHCEDGEFDASVTAPSLHLSFDLKDALLPPEASNGSAIMRLKVEELRTLPQSVIASTLHQDDKVHPFEYFVAFRFPGGRIIQLGSGAYVFDENPLIRWDTCSRVFLPAPSVHAILESGAEVCVEIWRELHEDFAHFPITDTVSSLVNGRGKFADTEFTKPGQSHYAAEIPISKSQGEEPIRAPDLTAPPEEPDPKKGKAAAKKPSSRNTKRKAKRPITAKDKKQFKVLSTAFQELTDEHAFDGRSQLVIDLQFSHALVLKPLVPPPTVKPSDLVRRNPERRAHRLQEATREFRQAVQRLAGEILAAQKMRQDCQLAVPEFPDDLRPVLNKMPSYHVALEKLRIAVSYTFAEFSTAHAAQTEAQMQMLQSILPMYLHDELQKQLPDIFIPPRRPVNKREFLVKESEEAEIMNRRTAATQLLEELLAMDLSDADAWLLYSSLMLKHGEMSRAEECVRRVLTCDPNHLKLSVLFASLLTKQEKYLDAIDFLNSAHFMDCRLVEVILSILNGLANLPAKQILRDNESPLPFALELMDMMDVVFAEQLIAQEQMAKGETADVLYMFGKLHYHLRDFAKAVSFLTRAVALDRTADALLLLGHVEFERERFEESAKWFDEGLEMRFEHAAALRLGFIYLRMGEDLKAESTLFQCSPQSASVLLGLAIAAINMEKYKQADELLNRATVVNSRHPEIWAHLALFSHKMDRREEALHAASVAKKWNLTNPELISKLEELGLFGEEDADVADGDKDWTDENDVDDD